MTKLMPAIFIGHGNPMNALMQNAYTKSWSAIGKSLPTPKGILAISAHWFVPGTAVTSNALPPTIHDFGGFPQALHQFHYPAPGSLTMAKRVQELLKPTSVKLDEHWGLDHGTWSVLCHMFPKAEIPVVQLSIDIHQPAQFHFELGERLTSLREEGILLLGSGNIVHNLRSYSWGKSDIPPYDWAARFEASVRAVLTSPHSQALIHYERLGQGIELQDAQLSVPTPEHFFPLLYILGTRQKDEPVSFPVEGFDGGTISMLSVQLGQ